MKLNNETLETVSETKLLGTILSSDLKWDRNTQNIVKRAYGRMELIRKLSGFGAPTNDLKTVYLTFIGSLCEQSCSVWNSSLTLENEQDLERIQKVALKIILKEKYRNYQHALNLLDLDTLKERRDQLSLVLAKKCLYNPKMKNLFPLNNRTHIMKPRKYENFQVLLANTERMKRSPIIHMQNLLNDNVRQRMDQHQLWNI